MEEHSGISDSSSVTADKLCRLISIEEHGTCLASILDNLRDTVTVNIHVNWPALHLYGVSKETPIDVKLYRVPARRVLEAVLQMACADPGVKSIGYSIVEGIVHVDTTSNLILMSESRVYNIQSLLDTMLEPESYLNQSDKEEADRKNRAFADILRVIRDTIGDVEAWATPSHSITPLRDTLIIKTTGEQHQQIISLLICLQDQLQSYRTTTHTFGPIHVDLIDGEFVFDSSVADSADNPQPDSIPASAPGKTKRGPGRPLKYSPNESQNTFDRWQSKQYPTFKSLAQELSTQEKTVTADCVKKAVNRVRRQQQRATKSCQEKKTMD